MIYFSDYLLGRGNNRLHSNNITYSNTIGHQALRHNDLELHLRSIRNLNLYSCFDVLGLFRGPVILNSDFRLPSSGHYLKELFWILHNCDFIHLRDQIILSRHIELVTSSIFL
jgi:hypothetical protein